MRKMAGITVYPTYAGEARNVDSCTSARRQVYAVSGDHTTQPDQRFAIFEILFPLIVIAPQQEAPLRERSNVRNRTQIVACGGVVLNQTDRFALGLERLNMFEELVSRPALRHSFPDHCPAGNAES
jgi:hypothetical protein